MNISEIFLIGVGLSMDAFAAAVCKGLNQKKFNIKNGFIIALFFGGFQALMPFFGWALGKQFEKYITSIDHWIAFALLLLIGLRMIWESRHDDCEHAFNPNKPGTLVYLAFATSVDALAVGITFTCMGLVTVEHILQPIAIIGAGSFLLTLAGKAAGAFIGCRFNFNAELAGGIILILLGIKIAAGG